MLSRSHVRLIAGALFCVAGAPVGGQTGSTFATNLTDVTSDFVFRMQRREETRAMCAVVYPDHIVRVESATALGVSVKEGKLDDGLFAQLESIRQAVGQIDPRSVARVTRIETLDIVIINIPTSNRVINLDFGNPAARKPFRKDLDPALSWLSRAVFGQRLASLPEVASNNCRPRSVVTARHGDGGKGSLKTLGATATDLILRGSAHLRDENRIVDRCFIVRSTGQFHFEIRTDNLAHDISEKVVAFDGVIDTAGVAKLNAILDAPELRSSTHDSAPPGGLYSHESEEIVLMIPRGDQLQRLRFFSAAGLSAGADPSQRYAIDKEYRVIEPLRSWITTIIENARSRESGHADNCARY